MIPYTKINLQPILTTIVNYKQVKFYFTRKNENNEQINDSIIYIDSGKWYPRDVKIGVTQQKIIELLDKNGIKYTFKKRG